jgi:CHASE3 domain sensor protein
LTIRITIGIKIAFAFLILLLLLSTIGWFAYQGYNVHESHSRLVEKEIKKQILAGNLRFTLAQVLMASNDYIITADNKYIENYNEFNLLLDWYFSEIKKCELTSSETALLGNIALDLDSVRAYSKKIFSITAPRASPKAADLMEIMDYNFGHNININTTKIFDGVAERIEKLKETSEKL